MEATQSFLGLQWLHSLRKHISHCCCSINRRNIMYNKTTPTELSITVSWGVYFFFSFRPLCWDQFHLTREKDLTSQRKPFVFFFLLGWYYLEDWEPSLPTYLSLCPISWSSGCFSCEDSWASVCESTCGTTSAVTSASGAGGELGGWTLLLWPAQPSLDVSSTCTIELVSLKESEPALARWNSLWPVGGGDLKKVIN